MSKKSFRKRYDEQVPAPKPAPAQKTPQVIRIKPDTYRELEKRARGFQTPDDVIRMLLGLPPREKEEE